MIFVSRKGESPLDPPIPPPSAPPLEREAGGWAQRDFGDVLIYHLVAIIHIFENWVKGTLYRSK
ncbi:MAG: hypothetical protein Tsb0014_03220 [Pleurocapsa sp.]